jgi:hypothetical protein
MRFDLQSQPLCGQSKRLVDARGVPMHDHEFPAVASDEPPENAGCKDMAVPESIVGDQDTHV